MDETRDICSHCEIGNIIEIEVESKDGKFTPYRYHCDNEKCGLVFRVYAKSEGIHIFTQRKLNT